MIYKIACLILLGQTVQPVKITDGPLSRQAQLSQQTDGGYSLNVTCTSGCSSSGGGGSGGGGTIDGGSVTAIQGLSFDGGADWGVRAKLWDGTNQATVSVAGALKTDSSATTQPISAASLPLPSGAAQDHTAAASPSSTRLSDGAAFYDAAKTGQLPSALVTGRLDVNVGNTPTVSATQSGTWTVQPGNTANTTAWKVDGSAVTQPVSGTVTANAGSNLNTSALALSATQTDRTQKAQITDGTRDGTVKAGSTAAQAADTSLVVGLSPNSPLPTGANVIGHTINDTGSTTVVTGNVTVVQPTGTNLHAVLDTTSTTAATQATASNLNAQVQGPAASGAAKSGNPVQVGGVFNTAQPTVTNGQAVEAQATARGALIIASGVDAVSVTANAGTNLNTSTLALSATQTDRTQKSQITDGTRDGTIKAGSAVAQAADTSLVVALSPNSPLPTGSNTIGALTANQSVNTAQFGGSAVATGTGVSGAGIPRVTVSSDSSLTCNAGTGTLAVSGPLTDTQLRASNVNVTDTQGPAADGGTEWGVRLNNAVTSPSGAIYTYSVAAPNPYPLNPFLPRCNAVRKVMCQP